MLWVLFWVKSERPRLKLSRSYLLCNVCEVSHRMGKWLAPNAIRRPHGLREPNYHLSNCYFRLTNVRGVISKSKHTHLQWSLSHTVKSYLPKPPENLTFSADNCDSEDHEHQEEDSVECHPTFEARGSSSQFTLLWKGDLRIFSPIWNCL
jgi:hypothetical protein